MPNSLTVSVDIADAITAINAYNAANAGLAGTIKQITSNLAQFDAAGNATRQILGGLTSDGQKFVAVLKQEAGSLDIVSLAYRKTTQDADLYKRKQAELAQQLNSNLTFSNSLSVSIQRIGATFTRFVEYRVLNNLTTALTEGTKAARDFGIQISLIRTISQENQLSTQTWSKGLREVSDQLGLPLAETAKAAYDAISNQVAKGPAVFNFLKDAGELARTTGGTIEDAGNTLASVINAYGKTASDAQKISALLFATIDDGRVKLDDLAHSLGPVTILAKGLGVSFEEVSAFLAFLTQKGVSSAQALTFIRNVFVQLEKPSHELKELFKEIGAESGKTALDTLKLSGVISRVRDEVTKGNTGVAALFPEIRANQPIQAALNDLPLFQKLVKDYSDGSQQIQKYATAIEIRGESPADFINKEFNKIKNTFAADIGAKINDVIKDLLVLVGDGDIRKGVNSLVVQIRNLAITFGVFKTTMFLVSSGYQYFAIQQARAAAGAEAMALSTSKVGFAMKALPFAIFATGLAYVITKLTLSNDLINQNNESLEILAADVDKFNQENRKPVQIIEDPNKTLKEAVDNSSQRALVSLSNLSRTNSAALDTARAKNKELIDETGANFDKYVEDLRKGVSDLSSQVTRAKDLIRTLSSSVLDYRKNIDDSILQTQLKFANEGQAFILIGNQIEKLRSKAKALFASGDPSQIEEAKKIYFDLIKLYEDRYAKGVDFVKQYGEQNANRFGINASELGLSSPKRGVIDVGVQGSLGKTLNGLAEEYTNEVLKANEGLKARIPILNKQIETEHARIKLLEESFKKVNNFTAIGSNGQLKGEFKNPLSGKLDEGKLQAAFDKDVKNLRDLAGEDLKARLDVENLISQRRKEVLNEVKLAERQARIDAAQQATSQAKEDLKNKLDANRKEFEEKAKLNNALIEKLSKTAPIANIEGDESVVRAGNESATKLARFAAEIVNKAGTLGGLVNKDKTPLTDEKVFVAKFNSEFPQRQLQDAQNKVNRLNLEYDLYQKTLIRIKENATNINGALIPRPEDIATAKAQLEQIFKTLASTLRTGNPGFNPDEPSPIFGGKSLNEIRDAALRVYDDIAKNKKDLGVLNSNSQRLEIDFSNKTNVAFDELQKEFGAQVAAQLVQIDAQQKNTTALQDLTTLFRNIGPLPIAPGKAEGGWIGGRPGRDMNLTPTTEGEFVVNERSASLYAPVLEQINSLRGNTFRSSEVFSTTVGDVNVNVYPKGNMSNAEVRDLAGRIQSEINRGALHGKR